MQAMAGRKLSEMADVRLLRKKRTMVVLSVIIFALLIVFGTISLRNKDTIQAIIHFCCSLIIVANLIGFLAAGRYTLASHILSMILFTHAIVLILSGGSSPASLYWIYPILATIVFVNTQKTGVITTASFLVFCTVILSSPNFPYLYADYSSFSSGRFLASIFSFLAICHFFSYQHAKTNRYILALYQEGIEDLAYRDSLTGLANRWSFERWVATKLIKLKNNRNITAVVFIDIDNFKTINDTYGHSIGDKVLQSFGQRLANHLRTKDRDNNKDEFSIARYAGDEFVVFLYDVPDAKALESILKRVLSLFKDGYKVNQQINHISLSMGVSIFNQDGQTLTELLRCADKAMYAAKCKGKNSFEYYHNTQQVESNNPESSDCKSRNNIISINHQP